MDLNELLSAHQKALMDSGQSKMGNSGLMRFDRVAMYVQHIRNLRCANGLRLYNYPLMHREDGMGYFGPPATF